MPVILPTCSRSAVVLALVLAGCAPPEADFAPSERARTAPPPALVPTEQFAAPRVESLEAAARLGPETTALAARAAALRARGAALSGAGVLGDADRTRLSDAVPSVAAPDDAVDP